MGEKKNKLGHVLGAAFLIVLTVVTFYIVFRGVSLSEMWSAILSVNPVYLVFALLCSVLSSALLGYGLHIPLRALCDRPVKFRDSLAFSLIGSYYSAITPSSVGGQPMQLYFMCESGISVAASSLALLMANVAYQIVVLLLPAVMLILRFRLITENVHGFMWLLIFGVTVSIIMILFILFAMFSTSFVERAARWVINLLTKLRLIRDPDRINEAARQHISSYKDGSAKIREHRSVFISVLLVYVVQMTVLFLIPYFIYRAFGLTEYGALDFVALQSVLYIAVCFLPLPGATGATESAFLSLFKVVFAEALIVPAMLLSRIVSFYLLLIVSGIVTFVIQFRKKRRDTL